MITYSTKASAEEAISRFDNQNVEYGGDVLTMKCKWLGSKISQKNGNSGSMMTEASTGFFRSAMDNPK